jgi:hypothetical protein
MQALVLSSTVSLMMQVAAITQCDLHCCRLLSPQWLGMSQRGVLLRITLRLPILLALADIQLPCLVSAGWFITASVN